MRRNLVSIIVCTRDRAESLRQTLQAIDACAVPGDVDVEMLVVDNGSQDRTRSVVRQAKCWGRSPRYLFEPRQGLSRARNAAIVAAQGDVLAWIDDDARPGSRWIETVCRPIVDDLADAVAGRVQHTDLAPRDVIRHPELNVCILSGANMAFARRVLEEVPAFDPELGPGALGYCDDTLFSWQLHAAGFHVASAGEESLVMHQPSELPRTRATAAEMLARQARSRAYLDCHWLHRKLSLAGLRRAASLLGLTGLVPHPVGQFRAGFHMPEAIPYIVHLRSLRAKMRESREPDAALEAVRRLFRTRKATLGRIEARWLWQAAYCRQFKIESRRPRHYELQGLKKLAASNSLEDVYATSLTARGPRRAA